MTCLTQEQIESLIRGDTTAESSAELRRHCEQCESCRPGFEQALARLRNIDQDLRCVICDYSLRGLTPDNVCPECGTPTSRSLHGDLLEFAETTWLQRLRQGVRLMLLQVLILVAAFLVLTYIDLKSWLIGTAGTASPLRSFPVWVYIVPLVVGSLGMLLLTTPEPRTAHQQKVLNLRKLVRVGAAAGLLAAGCGSLVWLGASLLMVRVGIVAGLLWAWGIVGLLAWLRRLAMRVPDAGLRRSTSAVIWGFSVGLFVFLGVGVFRWLLFALSPRTIVSGKVVIHLPLSGATFQLLTRGGSVVAGLLFLVFGILYVGVLLRYRAAFRLAVTQARAEPAAAAEVQAHS